MREHRERGRKCRAQTFAPTIAGILQRKQAPIREAQQFGVVPLELRPRSDHRVLARFPRSASMPPTGWLPLRGERLLPLALMFRQSPKNVIDWSPLGRVGQSNPKNASREARRYSHSGLRPRPAVRGQTTVRRLAAIYLPERAIALQEIFLEAYARRYANLLTPQGGQPRVQSCDSGCLRTLAHLITKLITSSAIQAFP